MQGAGCRRRGQLQGSRMMTAPAAFLAAVNQQLHSPEGTGACGAAGCGLLRFP